MAVGYGEAGATLVLAARTLADLERVAEDCKRAGAAAVMPIVIDVCQAAAVEHLVAETMGLHGRIDAFVANAGPSSAIISSVEGCHVDARRSLAQVGNASSRITSIPCLARQIAATVPTGPAPATMTCALSI